MSDPNQVFDMAFERIRRHQPLVHTHSPMEMALTWMWLPAITVTAATLSFWQGIIYPDSPADQ